MLYVLASQHYSTVKLGYLTIWVSTDKQNSSKVQKEYAFTKELNTLLKHTSPTHMPHERTDARRYITNMDAKWHWWCKEIHSQQARLMNVLFEGDNSQHTSQMYVLMQGDTWPTHMPHERADTRRYIVNKLVSSTCWCKEIHSKHECLMNVLMQRDT